MKIDKEKSRQKLISPHHEHNFSYPYTNTTVENQYGSIGGGVINRTSFEEKLLMQQQESPRTAFQRAREKSL